MAVCDEFPRTELGNFASLFLNLGGHYPAFEFSQLIAASALACKVFKLALIAKHFLMHKSFDSSEYVNLVIFLCSQFSLFRLNRNICDDFFAITKLLKREI